LLSLERGRRKLTPKEEKGKLFTGRRGNERGRSSHYCRFYTKKKGRRPAMIPARGKEKKKRANLV